MLLRKILLSIGILLLLGACKEPNDIQPIELKYFAENGYGEGVAVVRHHAGVHVNGISYVSYQGPLEDPYVAAYDHAKNQWHGPYQAGSSILGKDPKKKIDSHGKPTMIIDDMGYKLQQDQRAINLPGQVTYAFLPHTPHEHRYILHADYAQSL